MKYRLTDLLLASALLLAVMPHAVQAQEVPANLKGSGELVITSGGGTWEAAQKKAFFDPFTRDTGIKIVLVPEDHAKLLASVKIGQPEADLTSVAGGALEGFVDKDALEKIDYSMFAEQTLADMPQQMKDENGVGALLYSVGVAYNTSKLSDGREPKNWADFYNVKDFPGARSLPKCEKLVDGGLLEGALMGDGVSPGTLYPIDMDRAFAKVAELKPHVSRWWVAGADAPQSLISGEVDMAAAYNGRVFGAKKDGAPLNFSWDQSLLQYDYWVVLRGSPNKENASKFLAYISRPEPQAAFAEAISYGPVNNKAFELLSKELLEILPGSPNLAKKQVFQNYKWWNEKNADGRTNWDVALERCVALLSQ
ncbi:ABC transporter substrate-binding protein [Sinorhizobium medicae]|uniref:ABC transporter substrate-binding protein n=1 Tax=Sinorhizobium medicae TaxID=110321 RepID=UPI00129560FA|nr:ABC transporter substrate-binding protein [Sinorhizobium medicae]MDX0967868.1 extracellular solute-binding protein [Sinorhizobium medicae]MQV49887.1 extracellular solute-binding protein [Sinorhizobium medicae]MQV55672.1 extracellular solute-binding protein [Sinorhizobium medicae]MQV75337.1 extracellular solute-binding protein [Sinorhizobium medicae]WQO88507.1 ABC transporter substrate-binding protein [Sinorhizobium medicae]